jgi:exodeoxyribonuclease VII large subunit
MQVRSVTEVTRHVKGLIEGDVELADLWIEGEVSNFGRASSGHCYFTLKDDRSEIRCVMWRHDANRLDWLPAQGDSVVGHGRVAVYERGGVYQFYADALERGGVGARWQEFLELRARLQAEGLFDEGRKRPLPEWPRRLGVVTSPSGAAFRDILNILRARYPLVEVVLSPSLVQGLAAPDSLVAAIERINRVPDIDVVIIARGGGSVEDLWAFNDERVARALAASRAPVVSGIGHETDFTIADFVADLRAPTPSAAAASTVPDRVELRSEIDELARELTALVRGVAERNREGLGREERLLRLNDPRRVVAERRQRVDELVRRENAAQTHGMAVRRTELAGCASRLRALSPRLVLERGYALVQDRYSGVTIRSVRQVVPGDEVTINVHDGRVEAGVREVVPTRARPNSF